MAKIVIYGRNEDAKVIVHGHYDTADKEWSNDETRRSVEFIRPGIDPKKLPEELKGSRLWARKEQGISSSNKNLMRILNKVGK